MVVKSVENLANRVESDAGFGYNAQLLVFIYVAKERGIFTMVLTKTDLQRIVGGIDPEFIVAEKYYELIKNKVSI